MADAKYAKVASLLEKRHFTTDTEAGEALINRLLDWTERLNLPRLSSFGVTDSDFPKIISAAQFQSSMKTNPVKLRDDEIAAILNARM